MAVLSAQRASSVRRTTCGVGTGKPRRRCGHVAMAPSWIISRTMLDEEQRLRGEVVPAADAGAEALHDLVERAEAHAERPARVVRARERPRAPTCPRVRARCARAPASDAGASASAVAGRAALARVEELEHLAVFVDHDDRRRAGAWARARAWPVAAKGG